MLKLIIVGLSLFLVLFLYSACKISSKYSREEEKQYIKDKLKKKY